MEHMKAIPRRVRIKVKLVQTKRREGVAKARLLGAGEAVGEVLVFLDSHSEVNTHWYGMLFFSIVIGFSFFMVSVSKISCFVKNLVSWPSG